MYLIFFWIVVKYQVVLSFVRNRRETRFVCPAAATKSLKKLFQEAGVPPMERLRRFVVADGAGPVAAEGIGTAERVLCGPETTRAVAIRLVKGTGQHEE